MQTHRPDVVLLDEADRVPSALLKHLLHGAPRCVLAGTRTLLDGLEGSSAAPTLVELRPLSQDEVGPYLLEQIERAGLPASLLGPGTLQSLSRLGRGNPRRLQKLASRALFRAWIDNADQVSTTHVADADAQDGLSAEEAPSAPEQGGAEALVAPPPVIPAIVTAQMLPPPPAAGQARKAAPRRHVRTGVALSVGAVAACAAVALFAMRQGEPGTAEIPPSPPASIVEPGTAPLPDVAPAPKPEAANEPALPDIPPAPAVAAVEEPAPVTGPVLPMPPPPLPAPPLPRPAAVPVHVTVTFPPSDIVAGSRGVSLAGALMGAGLEAVLVIGPTTEGSTVVRYFYPADQAAAAQIARRLGDAGRERLASLPGAAPRPGTIQVVIASKPASTRPANAAGSTEEKKTP